MLTPHCRSQPAWDYRIKAFPWRLFEIVTIRFQPATIMVQDVWAATMLNNVIEGHGEDTWRVVTVELAHKSQDDFTFAISGTQGPPKRTALSCANDQAPPNTCALEPAFSVLNNYNGIISPRVFVQSWQIGAEIDLAFTTAGLAAATYDLTLAVKGNSESAMESTKEFTAHVIVKSKAFANFSTVSVVGRPTLGQTFGGVSILARDSMRDRSVATWPIESAATSSSCLLRRISRSSSVSTFSFPVKMPVEVSLKRLR